MNQMNIRIKDVKVIKNPFRDAIRRMMFEKEQEKDEKAQKLKKQKEEERWIDNEPKFELPILEEKKQDGNQKGLGLA